jgi:hypothetical protein
VEDILNRRRDPYSTMREVLQNLLNIEAPAKPGNGVTRAKGP